MTPFEIWPEWFAGISIYTFIVWYFIWWGSRAVLRLGRSTSGYRKLMKSFAFTDKLFLRHYIRLSKRAKGMQIFFVAMTYIGYGIILLFIILSIVFGVLGQYYIFFCWFIFIKGTFIELPALIFVFFNLCKSKASIGLEWKFQRNYRNEKKKK